MLRYDTFQILSRIIMALTRLRGCAGWSAPLLFANVLLRRCPIVFLVPCGCLCSDPFLAVLRFSLQCAYLFSGHILISVYKLINTRAVNIEYVIQKEILMLQHNQLNNRHIVVREIALVICNYLKSLNIAFTI